MHRFVSALTLLMITSAMMWGPSRAPLMPHQVDHAGTVSACMHCGHCFVNAAAIEGSCCQQGDTKNNPPPCDGNCCVMSTTSLLVILPESLRLPVAGLNGVMELPELNWQSRSDAPPVPPPWS